MSSILKIIIILISVFSSQGTFQNKELPSLFPPSLPQYPFKFSLLLPKNKNISNIDAKMLIYFMYN